MAGYTKGTGWRSRQLQIWVRPYQEGWAIPTSGSRVAMEKGREKSLLGSLGVVNVQKYRSWLQKNFYKLTPPSDFRDAEVKSLNTQEQKGENSESQ